MENMVAITGEIIQEPILISNINSLKFDGWEIKVSSSRKNGKTDEAVVIVPKVLEVNNLDIGIPVMIVGKMQTVKNFETGRVLVYVLADYVEPIKGEHWLSQNEVKLIGEIGKGTNYRYTPKGTKITDIIVIVPNAIKECNCFIPCICWKGCAEKTKNWKVGTEVELTGRLNSRTYKKQVEGKTIERICYEVSVKTIETK